MIDVEYWIPIIAQNARRIAWKMDAWEELEDIRQQMWLALLTIPDLDNTPSSAIHRSMGRAGANWVLAQKNLGMTVDTEPVASGLSTPLDRELIEWALPQISANYRNIIRMAIDQSDVWLDHADLKEAFKALSEVVSIYEG